MEIQPSSDRRLKHWEQRDDVVLPRIASITVAILGPFLALTASDVCARLFFAAPIFRNAPEGPLWLTYAPCIFLPLFAATAIAAGLQSKREGVMGLVCGILIAYIAFQFMPAWWKWPGGPVLGTHPIQQTLLPVGIALVAGIVVRFTTKDVLRVAKVGLLSAGAISLFLGTINVFNGFVIPNSFELTRLVLAAIFIVIAIVAFVKYGEEVFTL